MLDRHSEIIAHFIGEFDQAAEQSLYRLSYDAFRAQLRPDEPLGDLLNINVRVSSELLPDHHVAGKVRWTDPLNTPKRDPETIHAEAGEVEPVAPVLYLPEPGPYQRIETGPAARYIDETATPEGPAVPGAPAEPEAAASPPATPIFDIPAPGGIMAFVYQHNSLQDSDQLLIRALALSDDLAASRSDTALGESLTALAATADALLPGDLGLGRDPLDTAEQIAALRETYAAAAPETASETAPATVPPGAEVTLVSDGAGSLPETGLLVDGAAASAPPATLNDQLVARGFGPDEAESPPAEPAGDGESIRVSGTGETDREPGGSEAETEDSAAPVTSASAEIGPNSAHSTEDVVQLIEAGGNLLMNTAAGGFVVVDAPLIAVAGAAQSLTHIAQVNLLSDRDTVISADNPLTSPAAETSEGHNIAKVNWKGSVRPETDHSGGPKGFALTEIDGDLVLTTHVVQLNLVTDNDVITFETTFHNVTFQTGGNIALDTFNQLGFQTGFDMILVGGDMLNLVSLTQMNLGFDNDLVVDTGGVAGEVSTGDNLLWNQAHVTWHGVDTVADEMSDEAAAALGTMAGGQLDLDTLKTEALLDGKIVPLVLSVSGDLVMDYRLEQLNILADADTVQLFAGAAEAAGFTEVGVTTGGNVLANVAELQIAGTDSTIMAGGAVYSDVVLYQAGMYDTDATPLDAGPEAGEGAGALASEAVAFLADGMIEARPAIEAAGGDVSVDTGGSSGSFDVLGGVVA